MNELIREAADFYMNVYPQLTHGVEYKKIGIALINEYPCLACEDTINPHVSSVGWRTQSLDVAPLARVSSHLDCRRAFGTCDERCAHENKNVKFVERFTRNIQLTRCSCIAKKYLIIMFIVINMET